MKGKETQLEKFNKITKEFEKLANKHNVCIAIACEHGSGMLSTDDRRNKLLLVDLFHTEIEYQKQRSKALANKWLNSEFCSDKEEKQNYMG